MIILLKILTQLDLLYIINKLEITEEHVNIKYLLSLNTFKKSIR
jgi:hypothetical protein